VLDFGYIVERNGEPVHYFVSNICSLKVFTFWFFAVYHAMTVAVRSGFNSAVAVIVQ
jgi:hypothetical protein